MDVEVINEVRNSQNPWNFSHSQQKQIPSCIFINRNPFQGKNSYEINPKSTKDILKGNLFQVFYFFSVLVDESASEVNENVDCEDEINENRENVEACLFWEFGSECYFYRDCYWLYSGKRHNENLPELSISVIPPENKLFSLIIPPDKVLNLS